MNDDELVGAIRRSVDGLHASTPVADIIARGRAVRGRRRIAVAASLVGVVGAGAALAATAVLPLTTTGDLGDNHTGSQSAEIQLVGWTVTKQDNGDIDVTIAQLRDPTRLQARLRAEGLPVTISFTGPPLSTACQAYNPPKSILHAVADWNTSRGTTHLVIHPAALPAGTGLAIIDGGPGSASHPTNTQSTDTGQTPGPDQAPPSAAPNRTPGPLAVALVQATRSCTG